MQIQRIFFGMKFQPDLIFRTEYRVWCLIATYFAYLISIFEVPIYYLRIGRLGNFFVE